MKTFILIIFFHVGPLSDGNSNATTSVPGFETQQECENAGRQVVGLTRGAVKETGFVCVLQTKQ